LKKSLLILSLLLALLPTVARAQDWNEDFPDELKWSFELKGGMFYPALPDWSTYYGSDNLPHYAAALAYKLIRQVEVGVEGGYLKKAGMGYAPGHGTASGSTTYRVYALEPYLLFRGVFSESQPFVPYVGGGWTRMYYSEDIEDQGTVKGHADGYHYRAGLQLLLDNVDPESANDFYIDEGVRHTYLFFEYQFSHATVDSASGTGSVNLGGKSYLAGLLFEY
jgi:hypothetical protein